MEVFLRNASGHSFFSSNHYQEYRANNIGRLADAFIEAHRSTPTSIHPLPSTPLVWLVSLLFFLAGTPTDGTTMNAMIAGTLVSVPMPPEAFCAWKKRAARLSEQATGPDLGPSPSLVDGASGKGSDTDRNRDMSDFLSKCATLGWVRRRVLRGSRVCVFLNRIMTVPFLDKSRIPDGRIVAHSFFGHISVSIGVTTVTTRAVN